MSPTVTIFPPASSTLPPDMMNRAAEPVRLRPVEPVPRVQPQQQRSAFSTETASRDQARGAFEGNRSPQPAPSFRPAKPSSDGFFAQLMSQAAEGAQDDRQAPAADSSARGHEAYRRAGAQPALPSEAPELFRIVA